MPIPNQSGILVGLPKAAAMYIQVRRAALISLLVRIWFLRVYPLLVKPAALSREVFRLAGLT
jgi:hypothetical protein